MPVGRIKQAAFDIKIPSYDKASLNITQWRYIVVWETEYKIDVCIKTRVTTIEGITLDVFNHINRINQTAAYRYQYKCTHIPCNRCNGKGVIDWIDKVLAANLQTPEDHIVDIGKYKRNKKGPVNTYVRGFNGELMYSSTPILRQGEELCPECFGCGIPMSRSKRNGQTFFK